MSFRWERISPWDHEPLLEELAQQVAAAIGEADGVLVFDPSAFPEKGRHSVGVGRQWCGRQGKVDNCQVGVFLGYATRREHTLVDMRLYLPKSWTKDRQRRKACGVPKPLRYQTRHALALEMLARRGGQLPHAWIAGDDESGSWCKKPSGGKNHSSTDRPTGPHRTGHAPALRLPLPKLHRSRNSPSSATLCSSQTVSLETT